QQVLEIYRQVLGEDHPNVATSLNNLAALYQAMGSYDRALPLCQQALEVRRRVLGEDHPNVAISLNNLSFLFAATGRENEAVRLMMRAAAVNDRMIGRVFSIGSENQRMAYLESLRGKTDAFL